MTTELIDDGANSPHAEAATGPSKYPHAAVWLDHFHALVVLLAADQHRTIRIDSAREDTRLHRKGGEPGVGRLPDDTTFYEQVAQTLAANGSPVIVAGPSTAKLDFRRWLTSHRPRLAERIAALETLDHPTDAEFVAYARREFRRLDQLGLA